MTSLNPARRGSLIAATWLIGLGVIAARIRTRVVLGSVDIDVQGGVGSLRIRAVG